MLAPTRELVTELNRRARDHRLGNVPAGQEVRLGDGNRASVGDMIITRANDRGLRLSATDWVRNGDGAETGEHPVIHLHEAALGQDLSTAQDMAAVLDWRLPEPASIDPGPLPWLPGIPSTLHDHHIWGEYLAKRSQLVIGLAEQIRDCASQNSEQPVWAPPGSHPTAALLGEVEVWRAAVGINPQDDRPTGARQLQTVAALWQQNLDREVVLCGQRVAPDAGKRQVGGPSQDHQRKDRHRRPPTSAVRPSGPTGPRL
jgi:hypothetical protein